MSVTVEVIVGQLLPAPLVIHLSRVEIKKVSMFQAQTEDSGPNLTISYAVLKTIFKNAH
jgi:hypothetical protein